MKKFKIMSYIILVIVLVVLALTVYTSATQNNEEDNKEKVSAEIRYLDTKLVDLFNNMNNIETRNYRIYTSKIEESRKAENSGEGGSSSEGEEGCSNNSDSNSSSSSEESSENSDSNSGSDNSSGSSSDNTENENTGKNYEMEESGILTSDRNIDWIACKNELELIYTSVSTITLDLYSLNMTQDDILNFNKEIDNLTVSVESEDKQSSLDNLVKVYEYIPKFAQNVISDTLYKTILSAKLNVFKAYSKLYSEDWEGMNVDITEAINIYSSLLTNAEIEINKQATVNKGYVMLNELKNAIDIKNNSVFLIKYKNLLEEINNI